MGDTLTNLELLAFTDEMKAMGKEAGVMDLGRKAVGFVAKKFTASPKSFAGAAARTGPAHGILGNLSEFGERLKHPIQGLAKGWEDMTPNAALRRNVSKMFGPEATLSEALATAKADPKKYKELLGGIGEHAAQPNMGLREAWRSGEGLGGKLKGTAEELSRLGITGQGRRTKYIPIGERAQVPLFASFGVNSAINAPKATPTGEGGTLEHSLGEVGGGLGFVGSAGLGGVPMIGAMMGGQYLGSRLGRILDRTRSGATASQALFAPSPEEAQSQIDRISKFYGNQGAE